MPTKISATSDDLLSRLSCRRWPMNDAVRITREGDVPFSFLVVESGCPPLRYGGTFVAYLWGRPCLGLNEPVVQSRPATMQSLIRLAGRMRSRCLRNRLVQQAA
jgi:hypothetical protein